LPHTADQIDSFTAYCAEVDRCYFLPIEAFPRHRVIQLRLALTRNNQQQGVNWAEEYEFTATLGARGAVAQLGERRDGIAEARGSNPLGSIRCKSDDAVRLEFGLEAGVMA
jgi:PD-(D/E)XK endonuclease